MQKATKILLISAGSAIFLFIIAAIAVPFLVPAEKVKTFATQKISESINRTVSIKSVSFNIFEGIKLKGISVGNRRGFADKPFISAESFNLRYAFWPLFTGKVLIHEVELAKPQILYEKDTHGRTNLDDLLNTKAKSKGKGQGEANAKGIDLIINNISIKNGRLTYHDHLTGINEIKNLNLKVSGLTLALVKPIEVNLSADASYLKKDIPVAIQTKIKVDPTLEGISIPSFFVKIAGESFSCPIDIKNLKKGPDVSFNLSSKNLSIDTLLGIFATQSKKPTQKAPAGALTKSIRSSTAGIPNSLSIKGNINIENAVFQKLKLDNFSAEVSLSGKKTWLKLKELKGYGGDLSANASINLASLSYRVNPLNLKGFNAAPFINDFIDSFTPNLLNLKNKAEGTLDVFLSLSGSGIEMPAVFDNAEIDGVVVLTKGRLKKINSLENIAEKYNLSFLKHDILVKGLRAEGVLSNKVLNVKKFDLNDSDLEIAFTGGLDFNNMKYKEGNRLTLKFGPAVSAALPQEFSVFKDERGFTLVDFELLGSLSTPTPSPRLERPIEKTVGKIKVKIEAEKLELEEEAKEKIKEILKF